MFARLRGWFLDFDERPGLVANAPQVPLREVFRRFWPYGRPFRRYLWLSLLLVPIGPALDAGTIWLLKYAIDDMLVKGDLGRFPLVALGYAILGLGAAVLGLITANLSTWLSQRFLLSMRTEFYAHLQRLPLDFFDRRRLGDVVSRLTGDVAAIETLVVSGVGSIATQIFRILFFGIAVLLLQWQLAIACFIFGPPLIIAVRRFSRAIKRAAREKRRRSGTLSALAEETLSNIALVQACNRQDSEVERFHAEGLASLRAEVASSRIKSLFSPVLDGFALAATVMLMALGTWQIGTGALTVGGFLAFVAYMGRLYGPVKSLSRLGTRFHSAAAAAERIIEFLDVHPSVLEREDARALGRAKGALDFRGVGFRYPGGDRDAVADVSFSVAPGETVALVGVSGSGKSTLAKLALRFYDPAQGEVRLDGQDLRSLKLDSIRDNVAVLLQEALVFDGTVFDNIAYGRSDATMAEVEAAARAADAHEFIVAMPDGYQTGVGQKGRRLSGGQRQRIAIARAMIRDAPVLILDEPTTGLDVESGDRVLRPLRRLMSGRSTVVISHNLMTARAASRIVVLEGGELVQVGTHEELISVEGCYRRLWELWRVDGSAALDGRPVAASEAGALAASGRA